MKVREIPTTPAHARTVLVALYGESKAKDIIRPYAALRPELYRPRSWLQRFCVMAAQLQR